MSLLGWKQSAGPSTCMHVSLFERLLHSLSPDCLLFTDNGYVIPQLYLIYICKAKDNALVTAKHADKSSMVKLPWHQSCVLEKWKSLQRKLPFSTSNRLNVMKSISMPPGYLWVSASSLHLRSSIHRIWVLRQSLRNLWKLIWRCLSFWEGWRIFLNLPAHWWNSASTASRTHHRILPGELVHQKCCRSLNREKGQWANYRDLQQNATWEGEDRNVHIMIPAVHIAIIHCSGR